MRILVAAAVCLTVAISPIAFADSMAGVSKGETYGFYTTSTKITGTWGDKSYTINIFKDEWNGEIGGKEFKLAFWNPDVEGNLPCGEVKMSQWSTELEGVVCGDSMTIVTGNQRRSDTLGYDLLVSALVSEFPLPVQGLIREEFDWFRPSVAKKK